MWASHPTPTNHANPSRFSDGSVRFDFYVSLRRWLLRADCGPGGTSGKRANSGHRRSANSLFFARQWPSDFRDEYFKPPRPKRHQTWGLGRSPSATGLASLHQTCATGSSSRISRELISPQVSFFMLCSFMSVIQFPIAIFRKSWLNVVSMLTMQH